MADARRLQTGYMLTEFGSPGLNYHSSVYQCHLNPFLCINPEGYVGSFSNNTAAADANLLSWAMWEWKDFCRETNQSRSSVSQWAEVFLRYYDPLIIHNSLMS